MNNILMPSCINILYVKINQLWANGLLNMILKAMINLLNLNKPFNLSIFLYNLAYKFCSWTKITMLNRVGSNSKWKLTHSQLKDK